MKHCTHTHTHTHTDTHTGHGQSVYVDRLCTWRQVASTVRVTSRCSTAACCRHRRHRQHRRRLRQLCRWWLAVLVLVLHVLWKGARMTKRLEAMFTSERFFSAVQASVLSQVMFVFESFVTDGADERSLTWHHHITSQPACSLLHLSMSMSILNLYSALSWTISNALGTLVSCKQNCL